MSTTVKSRALVSMILSLAALGIAACGSEERAGIPLDQANQMTGLIGDVRDNVDNQFCAEAEDKAGELLGVAEQVANNPEVDRELRERTLEGAQNLVALVSSDCETTDTTTDETDTETDTTESETEPTETETETEPTETDPTETETDTTDPDPTQPGGGSGGGGGGSGGSGGVGTP